MAKIILASPQVDATTWQLAQALKSQQHEVVLLTSYGENPPTDSSGIEFMAYFRHWSLLEGLRIIPGLFGLNAQILHLLLQEDRLNPAQMVLATYAKSHPHCVLTTSLLHIRRGLNRRNPVRYLVEESDIITCPTIENLGELRGLNIRKRRQGRGLLPPVLNIDQHSPQQNELSDLDHKTLQLLSEQSFVVMPFQEVDFLPESDYFLRLRLLAQKHFVVLWGSQSHWSLRTRKKFAQWMSRNELRDRWLMRDDISASLLKQMLQRAQALVLAGLPLTPVELTEYFLKAIQSNCTLILDQQQSSVHNSLWKHGQNCWILNSAKINSELTQLLSKNKIQLQENLAAQYWSERQWLDYPLNELNRLYNRALEQKA